MKPRPLSSFDTLAVATAAFHRGDYDFALQSIEAQSPTTKTHALRSEILRRVVRYAEAHESARWAVAAAQTDEDRVLAACAIANSLLVLKRPEEALAAVDAIESLRKHCSDATRSRVGFARALMAWGRGDAVAAEREILEAYRSRDGYERMRARQLHAFVAYLREDHDKACEMLVMALEENDKSPSAPWEAQIVANISFLSSEMAVQVDLAALRRRLRALPWTPGLFEYRFWAHRNFGLRLVTDGGLSTPVGLTLLRQGSEFAVTLAQRTLTLLDASQASTHIGEREHAAAYLSEAERVLGEVDWAAEDGDERLALLIATELLAPTKIAEARKWLDTFHALPAMSHMQAMAHGNRLPAMVAHAEGIVAKYAGDAVTSIERFTFALETFRAIKYKWRAASAAIELHALTGNPLYRRHAENLTHDYPDSWLAQLLRK